MRTDTRNKDRPVPVRVKGPDGRMITLRDLPLSAFRLGCGHYGKDYGIQVRDLVFCETCKTTKPVKTIIA